MANHLPAAPKGSPLHAILSLIVPGLGQFVARARSRGITIFASVLILAGLSVWTLAQQARFPNFGVSLSIYVKLVLETGFLLVFLFALRHLLTRFIFRDPAIEVFATYAIAILFFLALVIAGEPILSMAGSPDQLAQIYTGTALYSAAALAGLWLWQVVDAGRVGALSAENKLPSMAGAILIMCLLIFTLGYNITDFDLPKAIREYKDVSILFPRILWPWKEAFAYDQEVVEETQLIQAPCPEGESGPPSNEPDPDEPWISATPTCGEIGVRDLSGGFAPGTELTITGGNFTPGMEVHILWKNPIGNPFVPRGVGETDITIDENGGFTTKLNIPSVVIPESTAAGEQIHTLVVREESEEVFSLRLSDEMKLALVGILETIMIGLMATFFGILLAFPLSFLAARNLMAPIVLPLQDLVGSIAGLVIGILLGAFVTGQIAPILGGLEQAPIPIFLIALLLVITLGTLGFQWGGRLLGSLLKDLGTNASRIISALILGAMLAVPGYYLGQAFSRGVLNIVVGEERAAASEVLLAYAGAVVVALLGISFGLLNRNPRGIPFGSLIYAITRTILNIVRAIEAIVYVVIFVIWVGLGPFAGTIALTLHTIASLAKQYSEAIESIDPGPLEAVDATGATRLQTIVYAVVPQVVPYFISFTIYRWDINVRMSTVLGLVGGGGIGFLLIQWQRLYQWELVGISLWLIAITVATLDYVSSEIRKRYV